ncbi:MAG: PKD domain-containing protein [Bacteroidota bacterium]
MKLHIRILLTLFLFLSIKTFATHIVGGVMNYRYLGGTNYEITMKLYRDNGPSITTRFDDDGTAGAILVVSLYRESDNALIQTYESYNPIVTDVDPAITNPCLRPTDIRVQQGEYRFNISVPNTTDAYYISYLRCCRNGSINNIVTPGDVGTTVTVRIPPINTFPNSNAVYRNFPPIFICQNAPLLFDHSAIDADGDSLFYELCNPYAGLDATSPSATSGFIGDPRCAAPYTPLTFLAPYTSSNPLGTPALPAVPITIDPYSGLIYGTPPTLGQFVVGVCVTEFRGRIPICRTMRDFQFNVVICPNPTASIPSFDIDPRTGIGDFEVNCDDYSVSFINRSAGATRYHWDFGVAGTLLDTSNLTTPSYIYPDTGIYKVTLVAYNDDGCFDSIAAFVRIYPVNVDFTFTNECKDTAVQFTDITTSSGGNITRRTWNFGDLTTSTLTNPSHLYAAAGTYTVSLTVTTNKGCTKTLTKTVRIYPLPIPNFRADSACVGYTTGFVNTSTGPIVSYNWTFGGGYPNQTTATPFQTYSSAGTYPVTLTVVSDSGCKQSITQNIIVNPLPIITLNNDTSICPYDSVKLNATGGIVYQWSPSLGLSNTSISNPVAKPSITTTYLVRVSDINRCANFDSVRITVFILPLIDAGLDTSVCLAPGSFRDSVQLQATGGVSYQWSPAFSLSNPNISNPWSNPDTNTYYYVTVTDANNCKQRDSVLVVVLDPQIDLITTKDTGLCIYDTILINVADQGLITSYTWTPTTGLSNPNTRLPIFYPLDTTLYILQISNYCYTKKDSVLVNVYPLPQITAGKLDSICIGDSIQLLATGGVIYSWRPDITLSEFDIPNPIAFPMSDNRYYVNVTDTLGCSNKDSVLIKVYLLPNTQIAAIPSIICQGNNVPLLATGGISYSWHTGNLLSDSTIANPIANVQDTILYYVTAINSHGCDKNDTLLIQPQMPVVAIAENDSAFCFGNYVQLHANGGYYYQWRPASYLSNSLVQNPYAKPDTSIIYTVTVSNDCFSDDTTVSITIYPLPIANAGPDATIYRGQTTTLSGSLGEIYSWFPLTGLNNPYDAVTIAAPYNTTDYILTVVDYYGCVNYDTVRVNVIKNSLLLVPTAFTPNGDGVNDIFRIVKYFNIKKLVSFNIYSRWGELVFSTDDINTGWDGSYKARPQPSSTFVWVVKGIDYDDQEITEKGNVTLIR